MNTFIEVSLELYSRLYTWAVERRCTVEELVDEMLLRAWDRSSERRTERRRFSQIIKKEIKVDVNNIFPTSYKIHSSGEFGDVAEKLRVKFLNKDWLILLDNPRGWLDVDWGYLVKAEIEPYGHGWKNISGIIKSYAPIVEQNSEGKHCILVFEGVGKEAFDALGELFLGEIEVLEFEKPGSITHHFVEKT